MPATFKLMSWNIRTFCAPPRSMERMAHIAEIILDSQTDIVVIQEVQPGKNSVEKTGFRVDSDTAYQFGLLVDDLNLFEPEANWQYAISGRSKGKDKTNNKMTDAYGFIWKSTPSASGYSHANSPTSIANADANTYPRILDVKGTHFGGIRRPGMMRLSIGYPNNLGVPQNININIVTLHAATACNEHYNHYGIKKGSPAAGRSIALLTHLPEIGGLGGTHPVAATTQHTFLVGDFNHDLQRGEKFQDNYDKILANFDMCIGTLGVPVQDLKTTYSTNAYAADPFVSSYDNIFFRSNVITHAGNGIRIDFISGPNYPNPLVNPNPNFAARHNQYYTGQNYVNDGVSDHMPVVATFDIP